MFLHESQGNFARHRRWNWNIVLYAVDFMINNFMALRQPIDQMTITTEIGMVLKSLRQRKISTKLLLVRLYLMVLMVHV